MVKLGAKALKHCGPKPNPGAKAQTRAPRLSWRSSTLRAGLRPRRGSLQPRDPSSPRRRTDNPDAGVHWKHILESNLHLSSSACGLASTCPAFLPTLTPPARQYLNPYMQPQILHPQLSSHSALEVNIIKYILILKYSVSILQYVSKVRLSHGKKESELTQGGEGVRACGGHPQPAGCSLPQPAPLLSRKGSRWGKRSQSSLGGSWFHWTPGSRLLLRMLGHGSVAAWAGKEHRTQ